MPHALRILHLLDKNRLVSGSAVQMMEAVRELSCRGHRVAVGSRPGGDIEGACATCRAEFLPLALRHPFDLISARHLRLTAAFRNAHIVHVHKGRAHAVALLATAGRGPLPRIVVNRGVCFPLDPFNRHKYHHPRVAAVVCVAEAVRRVVISSGRLAPEKVVTIHGGSDPQRFDPQRVDGAAVRRQLGLGPRQRLVGMVSLREWKGWRLLLAAAARLAASAPNLHLLFVGCADRAQEEELRRAAHQQRVDSRVHCLPFRRDMPQVLAACDVVVDPSTAGTGITGTVREAMLLGRPVVVSDVAGNPELVRHGIDGLVTPAGDSQALAAALNQVLSDPDFARELARNGRKRVLEHFTTAARVDRLEALYRRILGQESQNSP